MKYLRKNVKILNLDDLLNINGGYSGSSGGGGNTSASYSSSRSSSTSSSSSSSSSHSSGYSASSGGSASTSRTSSGHTSSSSYSGSSSGGQSMIPNSSYSSSSGSYGSLSSIYSYNNPRYSIVNGMPYCSTTGFLPMGPAYSGTSSGDRSLTSSTFSTMNGQVMDGLTVNRYKQQQFNYINNLFGENACAATSLLNEVSEIYTIMTGKEANFLYMEEAMEAAIKCGYINADANDTKNVGYVKNYIEAANVMAKSMGLNVTFRETLDPSKADCMIFGVDKDKSKPGCEHFYSSIDKNTYFDPWTGNIGSISDFAKNGWDHKVVCLTYK